MNTLFLGANVLENQVKNLAMASNKADVEFGKNPKDYIGTSVRLAGAEANCYPSGICTGEEQMVHNYTLYAKQYTKDDAIVLRTLSVWGAKMLEGGYITVITNVKDKQPIYRDEVNVSYRSSANGGRSGTDCGPFDPKGAIDIITNKCIHTFFLYMELAVCYNSLVGSFQQSLLTPGQLETEENDALNNRILDEVIVQGSRQTDALIWLGDQGSAHDYTCHFDGLVKKTFQAAASIVYHSLKFTFTGTLLAPEFFEARFGGETETFAFDTDTPTTIANVQAWLATRVDGVSSLPLATVAFNGVDELTVTSNFKHKKLEIEIQSTDGSGIGCTSTGSVTVKEEELQAFMKGDAPMLTPYVPITPANVFEEIEKIYMKAAVETPDLLTQPDFYVHVSPKVWACLKVASVKITGAFTGINGTVENPMPFGMMIVEQPGLNKTDIIFATTTRNIFFGTDLVSDMEATQSWINRDCQEIRMRHATRQGVQIDRFDRIASNLQGAPFSFMPAQEEDCTATGSC